MAMIRTVCIIAILVLGWVAVRTETFAHSAPAPTAAPR